MKSFGLQYIQSENNVDQMVGVTCHSMASSAYIGYLAIPFTIVELVTV